MNKIKKLDMGHLLGEAIRIRAVDGIVDIGLHWHSYYELIYYFEGEAVSHINGTALDLHAGTLYLLTPLDMHHTQPKTSHGNARFLNISFSEEVVDQNLLTSLQRAVYLHSAEQNAEIYPLILLLQHTKPAREKQYLLNTLLYRIAAQGQHLEATPGTQLPPCIRQSIRYIAANFKEPITLGTLAAEVHLNPAYLSDLFSKTCGRTFKAYLTDFRLAYAKQLLQNTDATVTEIAVQSGFQSLSHFLRTFKDKIGITPLQFRRTRA